MMHPVAPRPLVPVALLALALLLGTAAAQPAPLERLAPPEAILSLGLRPQANPLDTLARDLEALDWERARAGWDAFAEFVGAAEGTDDLLPWPLDELGDDLFGGAPGDGWQEEIDTICPGAGAAMARLQLTQASDLLLTIGTSPFRPLPAGVLLARVEGTSSAAAELYARLADCAPGEPLRQDGHDIHVLESLDLPIAIARVDDLFVAASDPEAVRGVLRRVEGEPGGLAERPIGSALQGFDEGGLRLAVDTEAIAAAIDRMAPAVAGGDALETLVRTRGLEALATLGGVAVRTSLTPDGIEMETFTAVRADGPDEALAALLRCDGCRASGPFLVPRDAIAASGSVVPLRGWVAYLDGWLADLAEAGAPVPPDVRSALLQGLDIDLDAALLGWIGEDVQSVRLQAISPDLRRLLYRPAAVTTVSVRSEEAALEGLDALMEALRNLVGALEGTDAEALAGQVLVREQRHGEVDYRRLQLGPATDLAVGVVRNRLVIASPATLFATIVDLAEGRGQDAFADEAYRDLRDAAPENVISWSYARPGADLIGLADTLEPFAQPVAFAIATFLAEEAAGPGGDPFDDEPFGDEPPGGSFDGGSFGSGVDPAAVTPAGLRVPGSVSGELGGADAASTELNGKTVDVYRLEGLEPGSSVQVEMRSSPLDTYLYRLDPESGDVLDSNDDAPDTSRSELVFVAPAAGEVWIGASSFGFASSGPYELTVSTGAEAFSGGDLGAFDPDAHRPAPLDAPGSVEAQLGDGDETEVDGRDADVYELRGLEPGSVLTVEMTSGPVDTYLFWLDPAEGRLRASNDDTPDTSRSEIVLRVPDHGRVWIAAASFGFGSGPYTVRVTREDVAAPDVETQDEPDQAPDADGSAPDEAGAADEEVAPEPPAEPVDPPTMADLLPTLEIAPATVRVIGEHLGVTTGWTAAEEGGVRSLRRVRVDW